MLSYGLGERGKGWQLIRSINFKTLLRGPHPVLTDMFHAFILRMMPNRVSQVLGSCGGLRCRWLRLVWVREVQEHLRQLCCLVVSVRSHRDNSQGDLEEEEDGRCI